MKKSIITEKPIYKVNLYYLLGRSYTIDNFRCDVDSLGKILVSVSSKDVNPYRDNAGECKEVMEGFSIPLIDCYKTHRFDSWYFEDITELNLPYEYNYWDKYRLCIVCLNDIKESNLATLEDLKEYNPQKEVWYKLLKEIQEKGIDFDYKQEVIEELYGTAQDSSNQNVLSKKI